MKINKLLLLHLVGPVLYYIDDARSNTDQSYLNSSCTPFEDVLLYITGSYFDLRSSRDHHVAINHCGKLQIAAVGWSTFAERKKSRDSRLAGPEIKRLEVETT